MRHLPQVIRESALRTGALDIGLLHGRPSGDDLDRLLVLDEPMGVVIAARHAARLAGPDVVPLDALAGLEWVGFPRHDAPGFHDDIAAVLRNHGLAAWPAACQRRDIGHFVAAFDVPERVGTWPEAAARTTA